MWNKKKVGLWLGPLLFALILWGFQPVEMGKEAQAMLAIIAWMAVWWLTEAIPIPITSLLPLVFVNMLDVIAVPETLTDPTAIKEFRADASSQFYLAYSHTLIFLFMGGFVLALAMEKWNLHRRIALVIIARMGTNIQTIILGFMVATAFLSMWISNTATTMMMVPIALAIVFQMGKLGPEEQPQNNRAFAQALLLSIAYAASIGGMATLVGTPTNGIFIDNVQRFFEKEIFFDQWFLYGFPLSILLLIISWWYMTRVAFPLKEVKIQAGKSTIQVQLRELGAMSWEEKWVLGVFATVAVAWISRSYLLAPLIPGLNDTVIVLLGVTLMFLIPARQKAGAIMDWETAVKLPWGILLLFGGALAVAQGVKSSGLGLWMADQFSLLGGWPYFGILLVLVGFVNFTTEITQNIATCSLIMPVIASLSATFEFHPYGLMTGTAIASSCAFMLPFATAPNAIVFGTGYIQIKDMMRAGIWLNILSILLICLFTYFVLPYLWDLDLQSFPSEFKEGTD